MADLVKRFYILYEPGVDLVKRFPIPLMPGRTLVKRFPVAYTVSSCLVKRFPVHYAMGAGELVKRFPVHYTFAVAGELVRRFRVNYLPAVSSQEISLDLDITLGGVRLASLRELSFTNTGLGYKHSASLTLDDPEEYGLCAKGSEIILSLQGTEVHLVVVDRNRSRSLDGWAYTVALESPGCLLDAPFASQRTGDYAGQASTLAASFAAGHSLSWNMVDWPLGEGLLSGADRTGRELLTLLAETGGGLLRSEFDGSLTVEHDYPTPVTGWESVAPAYQIATLTEIDSDQEGGDLQPIYNAVFVGEAAEAGSSETTISLETITQGDGSVRVRVHMTPWDSSLICEHTGSPNISMMYLGEISRVETETVEMVGGEGRCSYPVESVLSYSYNADSLGTITVDHDGSVVSSAVDESLLEITYQTRSRDYSLSSISGGSVQFVAQTIDLLTGSQGGLEVVRAPGDSWGEPIYDGLCTTDAVKRERGRFFVDAHCSGRKTITLEMPFERLYRMRELVRVTDPVDKPWTGMLLEQRLTISMTGDELVTTCSLDIEREVAW